MFAALKATKTPARKWGYLCSAHTRPTDQSYTNVSLRQNGCVITVAVFAGFTHPCRCIPCKCNVFMWITFLCTCLYCYLL